MKQKITDWKNILRKNQFFLRNFLLIFLVMAVLFSVYAVTTYRRSRNIIEEEFITAGTQELENISGYVENLIMDTRYMISTLVTNDFIQFLFTSQSPDAIVDSFSTRIQEQLVALQNSNHAIEAIYLYSEASNRIYTATHHFTLDSFDDLPWIDDLDADRNGFSVFPYAMRDRFPYVLCVAKELTVSGHRSIIAVMVNPANLNILTNLAQNAHNEIFMISDENLVFYRYHQRDFMEPLTISEYLCHYDPDAVQMTSLYVKNDEPYSFAQVHSAEYPWSYVLVTHLQNYTSRLSSSRAVLYSLFVAFILFAVLFAIFVSQRSVKPLRDLRKFLENPEIQTAAKSDSDSDIEYIAAHITQYVQTNRQLAEELQKRLNLLNETQMLALQAQINPHFLFNTLSMLHIISMDSLGYHHALPQMILNLSTLLRYSLEPAKMATLERELSYTDIYLSILNQRYGENLNVVKKISEETLTALVPKLFLQPIIENAIFHGFSRKHDSECILTITCYRQSVAESDTTGEFVILQIQDNGTGMEADTLAQLREILADKKTPSGKNIGLRNVAQRMNLTYSKPCSVTVESSEEMGTCFTLRFPFLK